MKFRIVEYVGVTENYKNRRTIVNHHIHSLVIIFTYCFSSIWRARMQSVVLLVVLVLSVAFVVSKPVANDGGADVDNGFEAWKTQFGKSYTSAEEESRRKSIWLVNKKMIEEHNKRADNGLESYTMGLNFFSDLESKEIPMGLKPPQGASSSPLNKQLSLIRVRRSRIAPPRWPTGNKPNRQRPRHPPPHRMLPEDAHPPPSEIPTTPEPATPDPIRYDEKEHLFPHHLNNHPFHSHEKFLEDAHTPPSEMPTTPEPPTPDPIRYDEKEDLFPHHLNNHPFRSPPAVLFTGKRYASAEEESRRKSIWLVNKKMIEEHNKRADNGLESYTMGLNFSDLIILVYLNNVCVNIQLLSEEQGLRFFAVDSLLPVRKTSEKKRLNMETETCPEHLPNLQSTDDLDREFEEWKQKFGKTYASAEEEARRKQLWLKTKKTVTEHNILYDKGLTTFTMGINQFADMLHYEVCCGHRSYPQN
ncbi:uncharacterized protein LOC124489317 [Hypomesus transpacificus]|uniref:uncharacterized protein LOC124489317 n=1 Tax=Hypomesus transpacificus TaxID=137520 RepID=UPI001F0874EE|nr:uncharacterized protein LOC124489317 [Hypomesus transpacificus]